MLWWLQGASIIRMLESFLGMDTLEKGLQQYLKKFAYGIWAQKSFCHKNKVLKFHEVLCCQKEIVFLRDAEMFVNNMFVSMLNLENMDTGMI